MFNKKHLIIFGVTVIATVAILFFIGLADDTPALPPPEPPVKKISVYVSGQVQNISVVELEDNGELRFIDAVNAAGGMTNLADSDVVNLAAPLTDGQHIHIPTKESFLQEQSISNSGDLVNINTAYSERLATLKGIGPVSTVNKTARSKPLTKLKTCAALPIKNSPPSKIKSRRKIKIPDNPPGIIF